MRRRAMLRAPPGHSSEASSVHQVGGARLTGGQDVGGWDDVPELVRTGWHYTRAPIAEAIIEIRCDLPADTTLEALAAAAPTEGFPTVEATVTVTGMLEVRPDGIEQRTTGEQTGHLFRSEDGRAVVQARLDGYSFGCLAPYDRWEAFSAEAERHWHRYRDVASPSKARRLGVRYVNRVNIPGQRVEIKDYLRTAVDVSPYLPQMISNFFLQVVVPLPRFRAFATVTSTIVPPEHEDSTSLILDIDTWQDVDVDLAGEAGGQEIASRLEVLREAKNYVFEACITDATRRLIE